jgi:TP901 family phage tail tape measure protein
MSSPVVGAVRVEITGDMSTFTTATEAEIKAAMAEITAEVNSGLAEIEGLYGETGTASGAAFSESAAAGMMGAADGVAAVAGEAEADGTTAFADLGATMGEALTEAATTAITAGAAPMAAAADTAATEVGTGAKAKMATEGTEAGAAFGEHAAEGLKGMAAAMLPMIGVLGLGEVAKMAVESANEISESEAKIAGQAGITSAAAKSIGDTFLATKGKSTFSAQEMAAAFSNTAGIVQQLAGHTLTAADAAKDMAAASDLAEASGQPLDQVTAALNATMQAYGLSLNDAGEASNSLFNTSRLTGVGITTLSSTVDKLHARLGIASPDLASTGALMVDLANHGIQGSRGVMVVQSALTTLLGGTKATDAELTTLGIHLYDAHGKFVGMGSVLSQLSPKLSTMTDKQRQLAEGTLFGSSNAAAMNSTLLGGVKAYDSASRAVEKHGAVESAAEKASNSLGGETKKLKATFDDIVTSLGTALIPILLSVGHFMLDDIVPAFEAVGHWVQKNTNWLKPLVIILGTAYLAFKSTVMIMGLYETAARGLAGVMALFTPAVEEAAVAEGELDVAMDANPIGLVVAAIAALVVGIIYAWTHFKSFRDIVEDAWHVILSGAKAVAGFFTKDIPEAFNKIVSTLHKVWNDVIAFIKKWGPDFLLVAAPFIGIPLLIYKHFHQIIDWLRGVWTTVKNDVKSAINSVVNFFTSLPGRLASVVSNLANVGRRMASGMWGGIRTIISDVGHIGEDIYNAIANTINSGLINPIKNWKFTIGAFGVHHTFQPFGGIPDLPTFAKGGFLQEGWNIVGENGMEAIFNSGTKQQVMSNPSTTHMLGAKAQPQPAGLSDQDRQLLWAAVNRPVVLKTSNSTIAKSSNDGNLELARR